MEALLNVGKRLREVEDESSDGEFAGHAKQKMNGMVMIDRAAKKRKTEKIDFSSDVLGRLHAFLPQLKEANDDLMWRLNAGELRKEDIDIENVDEEAEAEHIEMNLGLGVFDVVEAKDGLPIGCMGKKSNVLYKPPESNSDDDEDGNDDMLTAAAASFASSIKPKGGPLITPFEKPKKKPGRRKATGHWIVTRVD
ncbi:hypothetical protein HK101_009421 [Irineochytrium annulatum]|nr:hypothetical protein HK101_009421 [Irineochytrium annulatum]